ncbi:MULTISPECIES: nickel/cobalt efflux transporter [Novosphingobium]|uniref:Nickel/cobalt efflux system n=1 Tax=Novosphingobium nitrogenifigens DSM 19370 TaxID=983920 RepID=F1ZCR0_9SPHN|nr:MULTISPECIES: nickel/cobalt efflux transporter [Novosphingobium]EGD57594.1 nickel/cobalt efflux protein [Novosphingobium nitrogenifigens DSM 19370]MBF5091075.1 nickel/cobalt efflux transporter RcnA [Novosphingobium sp. NBM11]
MTDLTALLAQNTANGWLFIPSAIVLGALHGLEPGHSKTMMAAFIIAVKGTVRQAVLLGLAATLSHTLVVWLVAMGGMWAFGSFRAEDTEPYFQLASGVVIVGMALWMLWRARADLHAAHAHGHHHHDHDHGHDHHHNHEASEETVHELELATGGYVDAHEAAHAEDIRQRFAGRAVTTGQIVIFGLTGGLVPCPGAITVLMLCLQLHQVALGAVLVTGFSVGLALTMVTSGVLAALSLRHLEKRWSGFGEAVRKAPLISGAVILVIGCIVALDGARHLV